MSKQSYRPNVTFSERIRHYREYAKKVRKEGRKPMGLLSFLRRPLAM